MTRRRKVLIAAVPLLLVGAWATRQFIHPWWMRATTHATLEQAASSLYACMVEKKGTPPKESVRAGVFVQATTDDSVWPQRCEPWGKAAITAYREAWKWDDNLPVEIAEDAEWDGRFLAMIEP